MRVTQTVPEHQHHISLPEFLESFLGDARRPYVRGLIREGRVEVNTVAVSRNVRLHHGDMVSVLLPDVVEDVPRHAVGGRRARPELPVLYEDAACLVVDKPGGLVTVPDRTGEERGVHGLLEQCFPGLDVRIVHRLDRGTSGCLLLAKGIEPARHFDELLRERRIEKRYLAIVKGIVRLDAFTVNLPLGPDERRPGLVRGYPGGGKRSREAITKFAVLERFDLATLLAAMPETGRSHQIRVHLSHKHHPLWIDRDYGGQDAFYLSQIKPDYRSRKGVTERPLMERLTLHSERVVFDSPAAGRVDVTAPVPEDFGVFLKKLRRFAPLGGRLDAVPGAEPLLDQLRDPTGGGRSEDS
jgi:RluA family pseudouridine synthase